MNTTSSEIESVLQILQDASQELSISELSRKSGVNRNKVSYITEIFFKKGIVQYNQSANAKKYGYLPHTACLTLIDSIPDPAVILDKNLKIIRINQAFLDQTREGEQVLIGQDLHTISNFSLGIYTDALSSFLREKPEGYRMSIQPDQLQIRYTWVRVVLPDNQPGVLLTILPVTDSYIPGNLYRKFVEKLFSKIPDMLEENPSGHIYDTITRILRDLFTDDIIVSFHIDEISRMSFLTTLSLPDSIRKPTRAEIEQVISRKILIPFDENHLHSYKLYDTVRTRGIPALMHRSPEEILKVCNPLQSFEFLFTGIAINDNLTGIIGIGKMESGIPPEIYEKILQAVSRFFYLYESNRTKSQKTEEVVQEYQDKYRNIYHLLTEKTNLDESRKAESETLKALIGIILDQMNIVCCTLNPDMTISSANASMLKLCKAEETDIFKKPRIEDFFPSLLRDIFYELLNTTEHQTEIGSHQVVVTSSGDTSWCLIRSPDPKDRSIIYIGEKDPAALIQYILMYEYRNCSRASTRRISG